MDEEKLKHYLKTLVELDLYFRIKVLDEGTEIENIKEEKKRQVNIFLSNLPSQYKSIENYQEIVYTTLKNLMQKDKKKKKEEKDR